MLPLLIHTRRFPPRKYHAITLFPFVMYNGRKLDEVELRHEKVHLWQQAALLIVGFYLLYALFWLANMIRYRDPDRAYREIPFERSAYELEHAPSSPPVRQAFHWLKVIIRKSNNNWNADGTRACRIRSSSGALEGVERIARCH